MLEKDPGKLLEEFGRLSLDEQRRLFLFAPGLLRQELLLTTHHAKSLVASLPVQEAFFSVKEIGLADALPFLSLVTAEQLQYLTDLQGWEKDEFRLSGFLELLEALLRCGEDKVAEWVETLDPETLVLILKEYGWVTKYDPFKDPVEEEEEVGHITYDGYYRYSLRSPESRPFLDPLLRILNARRPELHAMIMESVYRDPPGEVAEIALKYRGGRLADRGVPDFESACEIYRPLSEEKLRGLGLEPAPQRTGEVSTSPLFPVRWLPTESFLRSTLRTLAGRPEADPMRIELAMLGNKVVVADGLELKEPDVVRYAFRKVAGYLSIGLEILSGGDVERARDWLLKSWLQVLYQVGYTQVHRLGDRARRLLDRVGFRWIDRYHCLADSPLEETLRGVVRPRPLFFEGVRELNWLGFREFGSLADVRITEDRIAAAAALSDLFQNLELPPEAVKRICLEAGLGDRLDLIKWSQIIQTLWAQQLLAERPVFAPLSLGDLDRFRRAVLQPGDTARAGSVDPLYTRSLLEWLRQRLGDLTDPVLAILEDWALAGVRRLEEELSHLPGDRPPDPRYLQCLCLRNLTS